MASNKRTIRKLLLDNPGIPVKIDEERLKNDTPYGIGFADEETRQKLQYITDYYISGDNVYVANIDTIVQNKKWIFKSTDRDTCVGIAMNRILPAVEIKTLKLSKKLL